MPKMHLNTFGGRDLPGPAGSACAPPGPSSRNRGGPTSKTRDISIDWPHDGTTSL